MPAATAYQPDTAPSRGSVSTARSSRRALLIVLVILAVAVTALALDIVRRNHGFFTFTLDDAYIHLVLARSIAAGHYGYNDAGPASPSSSIAYPFLLAPFAGTGAGVAGALAWNIVPLFLLAYLMFRWIHEELGADAMTAVVLTLAPLFCFNIVGLAFSGMEAVLQVLLCAVVCRGLWRIIGSGRAPGPLFWSAIVAGPLVRYETLALSVAAIACDVIVRRRLREGLIAGALTILSMAAFSLFLIGHGMSWLPDSVLAKADHLDVNRTGARLLMPLVQNVIGNVATAPGTLLVALTIAAVTGAARRDERRPFAAVALFLLLAQLSVGELGWWGRYEAWALMTIAMLAMCAWAPPGGFVTAMSKPALAMIAASVALIASPYLKSEAQTGLAANNIYSHHHSLGMLLQQMNVRSVALDDIGMIAWDNPGVHVLDVMGLASSELLHRRHCCPVTAEWLDDVATAHGVEVVMIYDDTILERPESWTRVGTLQLRGKRLRAGASVGIYTTRRGNAEQARAAIDAVRLQVPPETALDANHDTYVGAGL
jgi:hypothetical protein